MQLSLRVPVTGIFSSTFGLSSVFITGAYETLDGVYCGFSGSAPYFDISITILLLENLLAEKFDFKPLMFEELRDGTAFEILELEN